MLSPPQPPFAPAALPESKPLCHVENWGVVDYCQAWARQSRLVAAAQVGQQPNTLLLLEHPPVYTRGRLSRPEHIRLSPERLAALGAAVVDTDRGGQVTWHGPGQLIGWPIVNLRGWGGPLQYVRTLEQILLRVLADFGISAGLEPGLTGVWVGQAKIAAIGVKISRGIAHHGFALNGNPDLSWYDPIIPCGIADRPVTSMAQVLGGDAPAMAAIQASVARHFLKGMGFAPVEAGNGQGIQSAHPETVERLS